MSHMAASSFCILYFINFQSIFLGRCCNIRWITVIKVEWRNILYFWPTSYIYYFNIQKEWNWLVTKPSFSKVEWEANTKLLGDLKNFYRKNYGQVPCLESTLKEWKKVRISTTLFDEGKFMKNRRTQKK